MRITISGQHFELTPELVRTRLQAHQPEPVRKHWVDIDGTHWPVQQVIELATGVSRRNFISHSSRRWLGNLGFPVGEGRTAAAQSQPKAARTPRASAPAVARQPQPQPSGAADIVLIGCVKSKQPHGAQARDLYTSDYFTKMRSFAEQSGRPWFILSAEHGLVRPDDWLEPYERYLPDASREYQLSWGQKVATQLETAVGPIRGLTLEIHAGSAYVNSAKGPLLARGAVVSDPLQGLSFGRRLSWYLNQGGGTRTVASTAPDTLRGDAVTLLRDPSKARTLVDVMASKGAGIREPGLYSWWVDQAGARDISMGLGFEVKPGLIYAGLAGATRAGGTPSSNTLWARISSMHLGNRFDLSTLRWSLGSVLAHAYHRPAIDETDLTRWMYAHLRVVTVPVDDPDTLAELETSVLLELDPPLNLAKVASTPLRSRLSLIRKKYRKGVADPTIDVPAAVPPPSPALPPSGPALTPDRRPGLLQRLFGRSG